MTTLEKLIQALLRAQRALEDGARCLGMAGNYLSGEKRHQAAGEADRAAIRLRSEATTLDNLARAALHELAGEETPLCSECGDPFVPYRGGQETCAKESCQRDRATRLQRDRRRDVRAETSAVAAVARSETAPSLPDLASESPAES